MLSAYGKGLQVLGLAARQYTTPSLKCIRLN